MKKVAVVVQDGAEPFGLGAMCEVWAEPYHPEDDNPVFDFVVTTPRPGRVKGSAFDLYVDPGLEAAADADSVCVIPKRGYLDPSPEVVELVQHAHARCLRLRPLHGRLRARRGRAAGRQAVHDALATRGRARGSVSRGTGRRRRALRPGRATSSPVRAPRQASTRPCT
ncbi:hypothetical protein [Nocardioides sp. B-3]|uniref:hypothetical protein n=1 Tax=Nocardioides sp. B-3 TaxID=2895565 RepID=UPI0021530A82|nr:hypothetical protein [Nocardioides sp. B-3]UUZ58865.1 hypothetical protein LP418_22790 [Nocardioides sp. B-3]